MKYALIDTANTFFRARHIASRNSDTWEKIGMALHLMFGSVNSAVKRFGIDHVVFCLEGRSWRKDFYTPYKANRKLNEQAMTEAELEENKMFWETYETFTEYLKTKTNCSVLRDPQAEADDLIARFIALHPDDEHVICSSDTDYLQLLTSNVTQYNGVANQYITLEGYFDEKDRPVKDKKTGELKLLEDPQFILFEKCMRGDATDNVFSAYPKVRVNKLQEAFVDRTSKGFAWNNMMLQRWTDHNGEEHRVLDDYERNRVLVDLTAQPEELKEYIDNTMRDQMAPKQNPMVGAKFLKFCGKYELKRIADEAPKYAEWLQKSYMEKEQDVAC